VGFVDHTLAETTHCWETFTTDSNSERWAERIKEKEKFGSWGKKKKEIGPEDEIKE